MPKRYFSEKEAAKLVIEAAKLQEASADGASDYTPGLSFDELAKMAREAGIDPKYLEQVLEGRPVSEDSIRRFLGIPIGAEFESIVDAELPPDNFDVIAEEFENTPFSARRGGAATNFPVQVGRSVQVRVAKGGAFGPLKVTSRRGRTRVQAKQTMFVPFMTCLYPALIFSFVAGMSNIERPGVPLWLIPIALAVGSVGYGLVMNSGIRKMRETVAKVSERIREETNSLRDRLSEATSVGVDEPAPIHEETRDV